MGLKPTICWFESRIWKMVTVLSLKDKTNVFSVLVFSRTTTTVQTQPADGSRDINIHSALPHSLCYNLLAGRGLLVGDTLSGPRCQRSRWSSTARQPSSVKQRRTFSCQKQKPSSFHFLCSSTTSAHSARHAPCLSRPLRFPLPAKNKNKCTKAARRGEKQKVTPVSECALLINSLNKYNISNVSTAATAKSACQLVRRRRTQKQHFIHINKKRIIRLKSQRGLWCSSPSWEQRNPNASLIPALRWRGNKEIE